MRLMLLLALLFAIPAEARAQAIACAAAGPIAPARPVGPSTRDPVRQLPIAGYTLALSWSPQFCRTRIRGADAGDGFQCGGKARFGFVLHGLWPDGEGKAWPQWCRPAALIPEAVIRRHLCTMPSAQLQQHEWAKHGTCMAADPARYLDRADALFARVRVPDMAALSRRRLTAAALAQAFAAANPGLPRAAVQVWSDRRGWLTEVRICHDRALRPAACRAAPPPGGARPLLIWRGGARAPGVRARATYS